MAETSSSPYYTPDSCGKGHDGGEFSVYAVGLRFLNLLTEPRGGSIRPPLSVGLQGGTESSRTKNKRQRHSRSSIPYLPRIAKIREYPCSILSVC